jgi:hypothetical protein
MHETKPFGVDFGVKKIDPSHVGTGPRQARDQPESHRVIAHTEHNWGVDVAALAASEPGVLAGVAITATWRLMASLRIAASFS